MHFNLGILYQVTVRIAFKFHSKLVSTILQVQTFSPAAVLPHEVLQNIKVSLPYFLVISHFKFAMDYDQLDYNMNTFFLAKF